MLSTQHVKRLLLWLLLPGLGCGADKRKWPGERRVRLPGDGDEPKSSSGASTVAAAAAAAAVPNGSADSKVSAASSETGSAAAGEVDSTASGVWSVAVSQQLLAAFAAHKPSPWLRHILHLTPLLPAFPGALQCAAPTATPWLRQRWAATRRTTRTRSTKPPPAQVLQQAVLLGCGASRLQRRRGYGWHP